MNVINLQHNPDQGGFGGIGSGFSVYGRIRIRVKFTRIPNREDSKAAKNVKKKKPREKSNFKYYIG